MPVKKAYPVEFVYQTLSLLIAAIVIHAFWIAFVWPKTEAIYTFQRAQMQADPEFVPDPSIWIIIRDYEQEACFILMAWALAIIGYKAVLAFRERKLLEMELVPVAAGTKILPEDAREYARQIQMLPPPQQRFLLPRTLLSSLHRFGVTRNIQDAHTTAHAVCESEGDRLDSELAMVRYIAWAIPALGFIGTVRGIGLALSQAQKAVEGDISGVTENLGVAFNSTLIALLLGLVLMFLIHQLQLHQEGLVLDTESYIDEHLIQHLRVS
ncbi:MAG: MotA/TolQ/ExbB proton channel family protein [Vicinamibacteria bacterium]